MIDSYEPIPIFLNLSAFLEKKKPSSWDGDIQRYRFSFCFVLLYTEKEDEEQNTCMRGFNTALQVWVSCSWLAREKAVT